MQNIFKDSGEIIQETFSAALPSAPTHTLSHKDTSANGSHETVQAATSPSALVHAPAQDNAHASAHENQTKPLNPISQLSEHARVSAFSSTSGSPLMH